MRNIVIYIGSIFLPDKSAGAHRSIALSKSFRDLGYRVVIVGMQEGLKSSSPVIESKSECAGFETYAVPKPVSIRDWIHHTVSIREFVKVVEFYGEENIHSIVAMEYESIALLRLSQYCNTKKINLIADAEEWYEKSRLKFPMNVAKDLDTFVRMHYVYPRKIDNMICISRFFEKYYHKKVRNLIYIPGTIDPSDEKWKTLPPYQPNKELTIGYAGHPGLKFEKERLDWLVHSVIELNNEGYPCILKIAGIDRGFIQQRLDISLASDNFLVIYGKMNHIDCLRMLAMCDFTAIIREDKRVTRAGFPTKLSESFGCGTPVITTQSSNITDYVEDGVNGIISLEYSPSALKETLKRAYGISREGLVQMNQNIKSNPKLIYKNYNQNLRNFLERLSNVNHMNF